MAIGRGEWLGIPSRLRHVLKIEDLKFYECPLSCITPDSWRLLRLVNETVTPEGEYLNVSHLPGLCAEIGAIEGKYRQAVAMVKEERAKWRQSQINKK